MISLAINVAPICKEKNEFSPIVKARRMEDSRLSVSFSN
jgi:hypothetical protein